MSHSGTLNTKYYLPNKTFMNSEERITLTDFHGHSGPYSYIGYRMGKLVLTLLEARGKKLNTLVKTGTTPPISCMIDGIQFSTPCTLGKGNISVVDEKQAEAVFEGEKTITIRLKDEVKASVDSQKAGDQVVEQLTKMTDEQLFEVI